MKKRCESVAKALSLRGLVERHVLEHLAARGFAYTAERMPTFRRVRILPAGTAVQIVEFQGGVKLGSFGTFVVNLGVYSPELTQPPRDVKVEEAHSWNCMVEMKTRLAHLADPCPRGALMSLVTGEGERQQDLWWSCRGSAPAVVQTFHELLALFADRGEAWFDAMTSVDRFEWAYAARGSRVAGHSTSGGR